jgi:hypothetical protein
VKTGKARIDPDPEFRVPTPIGDRKDTLIRVKKPGKRESLYIYLSVLMKKNTSNIPELFRFFKKTSTSSIPEIQPLKNSFTQKILFIIFQEFQSE